MIDIKELENVVVDNIDKADYPDFCDAYISSAEIDGIELTETELDELQEQDDYYDLVLEIATESIFG
jgi:hypothetical protein